MTCTDEHERQINRRRYQRYEIDTQLHVVMLGLEQRGTLRGRSLNISEAGIAGVFVTVWDVGAPVRLELLRCGVWELLRQPSADLSPWPNVLSVRQKFLLVRRHSWSGFLVLPLCCSIHCVL